MRATVGLVLSMMVLGACGPNEDNWSKKSAKDTCKFSKRCATANFYASYTDMDDCLNQTEAALDAEALEKAGECSFDSSQARECLQALSKSCKTAGEEAETLFDPCLRAWNCGAAPIDTAAQ